MAAALRRLFGPVSIALLVMAAAIVPLPAYLQEPGRPVGLDAEVNVEEPAATALDGDFLLVTVDLRQATPVLLVRAWLDPDVGLEPQRRVIPPGETDAQYFRRQRAIFGANVELAAAVGLAAAGYPIDPAAARGDGARVRRVLPSTPAAGVLRAGDVIVAVDAQPIGSYEELRAALEGPPTPRAIVFDRDGRSRSVTLTPEPVEVGDRTTVVIGVEAETANPRRDLPVPVSVGRSDIGGPSAGLLVALTVYDKVLPDVDLLRGRRVAGTGTIREDGAVGRVGGIVQKVQAAARAGADLLLVPAEQLGAARAALPGGSALAVVGVATFAEALAVLQGASGADARIAVPPGTAPGG